MLSAGRHVLLESSPAPPALDKHVFRLASASWPIGGDVLKLAVEMSADGSEWYEAAHFVFGGINPDDPNPKLRQWPSDSHVSVGVRRDASGNRLQTENFVRVVADVYQECEMGVEYRPEISA